MQRKFLKGNFWRTVLLEPARADSFNIRVDSNVEFSETTEGFGQTVLLEPTRADSCDIRVGSNVEQVFLYKTLRTLKRRSQRV